MYETKAMIPLEVDEPGLDLLNEFHDKDKIREAACKLRAVRRYNTKVRPRSFHKGDLV